jgi:hypothetical protein
VTLLALALQPAVAQEKMPLQLGGVAMFTDGRNNVAGPGRNSQAFDATLSVNAKPR